MKTFYHHFLANLTLHLKANISVYCKKLVRISLFPIQFDYNVSHAAKTRLTCGVLRVDGECFVILGQGNDSWLLCLVIYICIDLISLNVC